MGQTRTGGQTGADTPTAQQQPPKKKKENVTSGGEEFGGVAVCYNIYLYSI
jgi:hypothetical protein